MNQREFLQLTANQENTSTFPYWVPDTLSQTAAEDQPFKQLYHKIAERVALSATFEKGAICRRLPSDESAYPFNFQFILIVGLSGVNILYQSFKNICKILIFHKGKLASQESSAWQDFYTEGPADGAWTVSNWVFDAHKECAFPEDIVDVRSELSGLLNSFKKGLPLEKPKVLLSMAEQVAKQYYERKDEDIEVWAEKLSKDLSKLSD